VQRRKQAMAGGYKYWTSPPRPQLAALRRRLSDRVFQMLFVDTGITNNDPT